MSKEVVFKRLIQEPRFRTLWSLHPYWGKVGTLTETSDNRDLVWTPTMDRVKRV